AIDRDAVGLRFFKKIVKAFGRDGPLLRFMGYGCNERRFGIPPGMSPPDYCRDRGCHPSLAPALPASASEVLNVGSRLLSPVNSPILLGARAVGSLVLTVACVGRHPDLTRRRDVAALISAVEPLAMCYAGLAGATLRAG